MEKALLEEHVRYGEARFRDKELVRPFVNRIYQDLAEIEAVMKPKTCEGCKHIKGIKPKLGQTYCAIGIEDLNYDLGVKKEFCCNKHEPKDN